MTYVADNFQRANGSLGGFWTTPKIPSTGTGSGSINIVNNGFTATVAAGCNQCNSVVAGYVFGNDHWAQAQLNNTPTNKSVVHITACTSSAGTSTFTYTLTSGVVLFVGMQIYISGMQNSGNNTTVGLIITGLGVGTFSVANASPGANESGSTGTGTVPGDLQLGIVVRGTPDGQNGYFCFVGTNSGAFAGNGTSADQRVYCQELWKVVNGVFTFISYTGVLTSIPDVAGTVYRLTAVGTTITLYRNGVKLLSTTDSSLTSGSPGILIASANGSPEYATPTAFTGGGDNSIQWTNFLAGDTPGQLASDNFARGAGGLGANWTTNPSETAPTIASSGVVQGTTLDVNNGAFYNAVALPNDQYSEGTLGALAVASNFFLVKCRQSGAAKTSYFLQAAGPVGAGLSSIALFKVVAGSQTQLGSTLTSQTVSIGDIFRVSAVGTTITGYQNGFQIIQATDNTIASGSGGFTLQAHTAETNDKLTLWAGGNPSVTPSTGPLGGASSSWLTLAMQNSLRGVRH